MKLNKKEEKIILKQAFSILEKYRTKSNDASIAQDAIYLVIDEFYPAE